MFRWVPLTLRMVAGLGLNDRVSSFLDNGALLPGAVDAARNDQLSTITLLLDLGATIDGEPYYGTALHWAAFFGKRNAVELLVQRGADVQKKDRQIGATPAGWASVFGGGGGFQLFLEDKMQSPKDPETTG